MSLSFHHTVLANGLEIVGEHNPQAQSVALGYFVKTGSRDESPEISGVSHFLEHMMFKGTAKRSASDINREFDELGANYNAFTSEERTVYYGAVVAEKAPLLLDLLSDMMRPALRQEDFEVEKKVILEEIAMYQDRVQARLFDKLNQNYFRGHPLGNSVLGTSQSISDLRREQMQDYFTARYAPNNMLLCVSGRYDWSEILNQVSQLTQAWQRQDSSRLYPTLNPASGKDDFEDAKVQRIHVAVSSPGFAAQDERVYAANILAYCIGGGVGSRLYWALEDKGLVDSVSFWHDSADGLGNFMAYLSMAKERYQEVMDIFYGSLAALKDKTISEEEWLRAKRKIATALTLRGETPFGRLMSFGSDYQYRQEYTSVREAVDKIMAVPLAAGQLSLEKQDFYSLSLKPALKVVG